MLLRCCLIYSVNSSSKKHYFLYCFQHDDAKNPIFHRVLRSFDRGHGAKILNLLHGQSLFWLLAAKRLDEVLEVRGKRLRKLHLTSYGKYRFLLVFDGF